jgi:hypothetical protein
MPCAGALRPGAEIANPARIQKRSLQRPNQRAAAPGSAPRRLRTAPDKVKVLQRLPGWARAGAPRLVIPVLLCCAAVPAAAQQAESACAEGRISSVFIDNHSVFDLSDPDLNMRFGWAYRLANGLHPATRQGVIRRELLFAPGDCYDVELLRDSERLLRSLQFIAAVDIFGVRQPDGTIHVLVDTRDEWSLRVDPEVGGGDRNGLTGVRIGEDNLFGTGTHLSGFYLNDQEEQVYGGSFFTPQLFGTRWDAALDVGRTPVGNLLYESVTYPFVGEVGRWGLRQAVQLHDRYFEYLVPGADDRLQRVWFPERRTSADAGLALRLGNDGYNRTVLGAAVAGEWVSYPEDQPPRFADPELADSIPDFAGLRRDTLESVRALFMVGQRNVYYLRGRRLDTVNGTEDVRLGVETEVALGPSIPGLTHRQDLAVDLVLSAGGRLFGGSLAGGQLIVEGRRDYRASGAEPEWADVFGQLNLWSYLRTSSGSPSVLVAALNAAGGWHDRVPFQLTLGRDAGLRGYPAHIHPGARRIVGTLEERVYLGWPFPDLFDTGAVAFVDAGKIWAGSAPFGETSPIRANAGFGLRLAFPPGSRQTLRLDVGVPVGPGGGFGNAVFSAGMGQAVGARAVTRDGQLTRSTRQGVSPSIFVVPPRRR